MKRLAILSLLALAAGCASMPQDGVFGAVYGGNDKPTIIGRCPYGQELRISDQGFECVSLTDGS